MWNDILNFFRQPWVVVFVFFVAPLIYAWFNLGPSDRKPDRPMDQLHEKLEKAGQRILLVDGS